MSECVSERCVFKYWQMNGRANHARSLKMINLPKWVKVVFSECAIESNRINSNWWGCCCCCGDFSFILFSDAISSNSRPNGSKRKSRTTCVLHEICILAIQRLGSWFFPYLFKWASTATQSKAVLNGWENFFKWKWRCGQKQHQQRANIKILMWPNVWWCSLSLNRCRCD